MTKLFDYFQHTLYAREQYFEQWLTLKATQQYMESHSSINTTHTGCCSLSSSGDISYHFLRCKSISEAMYV